MLQTVISTKFHRNVQHKGNIVSKTLKIFQTLLDLRGPTRGLLKMSSVNDYKINTLKYKTN
jgi:hypothetical protein